MKIAVILGSTREIRRGARVAKWLMPQLQKIDGVEFELLDLRDYPLPYYAESNSPDSLENGYSNEVATKWAAKIGEADGFLLIVSEYNHGPTAALKNALDYVYTEWNKKPVGFVSYATGLGGGVRAVEQLKQICVELEMAPMQDGVIIRNILDTIDEAGNILAGHANEQLEGVMKQLLWWTQALKAAREAGKDS